MVSEKGATNCSPKISRTTELWTKKLSQISVYLEAQNQEKNVHIRPESEKARISVNAISRNYKVTKFCRLINISINNQS